MERELANLKESYLKGVKPLSTFKELQGELGLLNGGDLPFTKEEFSIRWKRSVRENTFMVSFDDLTGVTPAQFDLITINVKTYLVARAVRTELKDINDGDVKGVKSLCDKLQVFAGKGQPWYTIFKEKDGFMASEMDSKIRAGGSIR